MTDAEIFHNETTQFGGRLARETIPIEASRAFYAEIIERGTNLIDAARHVIPTLPPIHFDFILNGAVNAMAFKSHNRYFIGLNTGTLYILRFVTGRMLSDSRLLLFVGVAKDEQELEPFSNYQPDAEEIYKKAPLSTPKNAIRASYASFLLDQAILFFVGHEITHITHGHVDYLMSKRGANITAELEWVGSKHGDELLERQCLEMDADRRSIISRIDSLKTTYSNPNFSPPPWSSESYTGPQQLLLDWWISLNILFRLFGDVRFTHSALKNSNYPPLALRRAMCLMAAFGAVDQLWDSGLMDVARKVFKIGYREAELAFATMLGEKPSVEGVQQAFSKTGREHAIKLEHYWNSTVLERVRPFSYELQT